MEVVHGHRGQRRALPDLPESLRPDEVLPLGRRDRLRVLLSDGRRALVLQCGAGQVVDVLPLSNGYVYSRGRLLRRQFTSDHGVVIELLALRDFVNTYTMRLLRLSTPGSRCSTRTTTQPPYPLGSQPVQKGTDSLYAYYDGWFLSSSGLYLAHLSRGLLQPREPPTRRSSTCSSPAPTRAALGARTRAETS